MLIDVLASSAAWIHIKPLDPQRLFIFGRSDSSDWGFNVLSPKKPGLPVIFATMSDVGAFGVQHVEDFSENCSYIPQYIKQITIKIGKFHGTMVKKPLRLESSMALWFKNKNQLPFKRQRYIFLHLKNTTNRDSPTLHQVSVFSVSGPEHLILRSQSIRIHQYITLLKIYILV